jgi:hypothetical protein
LLSQVLCPEKISRRVDEIEASLSGAMSSSERRELAALAQDLKVRIGERRASLEAQLNEPGTPEIRLLAGAAPVPPSLWKAGGAQGPAELSRTECAEGLAALRVSARAASAASWRADVLLPKGKYRFEGRLRVEHFAPLPFGKNHGADLRVAGAERGPREVSAPRDWSLRNAEFEVGPEQTRVQLVCEYRACGGEAWFDLNSLRIVRLP